MLIANNILYTAADGRLIDKATGGTVSLLNNDYFAADGAFRITYDGVNYDSLAAFLAAVPGQERFDKDGDGAAEVVALDVDPRLADAGRGGTINDPARLEELLGAYRPSPDSPLVDAGLDLTRSPFGRDVGGSDFYGVAVPQGSTFDVGASEAVPEPASIGLVIAAATLLVRLRARIT